MPDNEKPRVMQIPPLQIRLYLLLVGPAHVWIWICAKVCGVTVNHEWQDHRDSPTQDGE